MPNVEPRSYLAVTVARASRRKQTMAVSQRGWYHNYGSMAYPDMGGEHGGHIGVSNVTLNLVECGENSVIVMGMRRTLTTTSATLLTALALSACGSSGPKAEAEAQAPTTAAPVTTTAPVVTTQAPTTTIETPCTEGAEQFGLGGREECHDGEWVKPTPPTTVPVPMLSRETIVALIECQDAVGGFTLIELIDTEPCDNADVQLKADGLDTEMVNATDSIGLIIAKRNMDAAFIALKALDGSNTPDDEATFHVEGMEFDTVIDAFIDAHS